MTEKYCPKCQSTLPLESFGVNRTKTDGKQAYCIECMKAVRKAHYLSNKAPYLARARANEAQIRQVVREAKSVPCFKCGIEYPDEPWLMEFDHREQSTKEHVISNIFKLGSMKKALAEIAKCDILCVVCHRRRTAIQLGW